MTKDLMNFESLREPMAIGEVFAESGMFPDVKTQAQAVVKILAGRELGLSPFQSVSGVYMVNGKLALQSNVMSSLVKNSKKYDYTVNKLDNEECSLTFFKGDIKLGDSVFTIKDAAKAGIINKDVWKNYPRNMLFARALSNGTRWFCPEIICGWHTVEEMQDITIDTNESNTKIVEITPEGEVINGTQA